MTLLSSSSLSAGKTLLSTIGPAEVPRMNGQVWSFGLFRVKTTVLSSLAVTDFMFPMSDAGPFGSLIVRTRLYEKTTSLAVIVSPLENFWLSLRMQVYSVGCVNEQLFAASGWGLLSPAGTFMRN